VTVGGKTTTLRVEPSGRLTVTVPLGASATTVRVAIRTA
jgi:hypothetical protein